MAQETWLMVAVGAGFLLLGIAASPLAWVALLHFREMGDRESSRRYRELSELVRALRGSSRAMQEASLPGARDDAALTGGPRGPVVRDRVGRRVDPGPEVLHEPRLIAVPKLAAASPDRPAMHIRTGPAVRRHLGAGRVGLVGRRNRPRYGDRSTDRPGRADPRPPPPDGAGPRVVLTWRTRLTPSTPRLSSAAPGRPCSTCSWSRRSGSPSAAG